MALEIERRFIVQNDLWKDFIIDKTFIEQGYFTSDLNDWITRIRFDGKHFKITLKKHIKNFTNYEFEYEIPFDDGEKIMATLKNKIKKERFLIKIDRHSWFVDCFKDNNSPLKIAEIELSSEKESFKIPSFLSQEITGSKIFSNFNLSKYPFSEWKDEDYKIIK